MSNVAARSTSRPAAPALQGEIQSITIPYLFHQLAVSKATGILSATERGIRKSVQLSQGTVLFASSTDRDDRLNQLLLKADAVSLQNLLKALEVALATKDRLGEVLIRWKIMTQTDVEAWVKVQVREIICSLFNWTHGQYVFEQKPVDQESITLGVPGDIIVVEGVRRVNSWARAYEQVGGLNAEYLTAKEMPRIIQGLPFKPEERALLEMCAEPATLGDLCAGSKLPDYEVCRSIWTFLILGAVMKA